MIFDCVDTNLHQTGASWTRVSSSKSSALTSSHQGVYVHTFKLYSEQNPSCTYVHTHLAACCSDDGVHSVGILNGVHASDFSSLQDSLYCCGICQAAYTTRSKANTVASTITICVNVYVRRHCTQHWS
jgi:hypothetical protein